ncbi:MAG: trimethylamine methyltransferase family protein [Nitrososphaerales archaeon]
MGDTHPVSAMPLAVPTYRLLDEQQIRSIHHATLEVLETTGVRVSHDEALQLLRDSGCHIKGKDIVLIPNWLVEQSISYAPSRITIYNREGQEAMRLEGRNNYYGLGTDLIRTQDVHTGATRASVLQDVVNAARVSDACANIDFIASFALPSDVPTNLMYVACVKAQLENSAKPVFFTAAGREDIQLIHEMAAAVAGGEEQFRARPFLINYSEPTPPLTHSYGALAKLLFCAEKGIPVCYTPAAMLGASAPVTVAAGLVQTNAEALSGLVIHQLKARGAPIISGVALPPLDMRTSAISYAAPELRLANSAFADLYHYYDLPMWSSAGSDSHTLDTQAAWENAMGILLASLDGAHLIHDVAYLGQGLLGNPAMIVLCDEQISYVKRILRGVEVDRGALAVETIRSAGPGGNYLTAEHTLQNFRAHVWQPSLVNRDNPDAWAKKGSQRYEERVVEKTLQILETHRPRPLPAALRQRLAEIYERADRELARVQFAA